MARHVGIWADHERAFIVSIKNHEEKIICLESGVGGHFRLSGGSRSSTPYGPQEVSSERKMDERHRHHLRRYYRRIIHTIRDADRVFIFGPGEARTELKKEIKKSKELSSRIVGLEPADKMTEKQILAKVRAFFGCD